MKVKYKKSSIYELTVIPSQVLSFRENKLSFEDLELGELTLKGGNLPSKQLLNEDFPGKNENEILVEILKKGNLQVDQGLIKEKLKLKKNSLVEKIFTNCVNAQTGYPFSRSLLETSLNELKLNYSNELNFEDVLKGLRLKLPIKLNVSVFILEVEPNYLGLSSSYIHKNSKILKEDWLSNGSWKVKVEVPKGFSAEFIDKLNSMSHGKIIIKNE